MFLETLQFFTGIFVVVYDGQHALKFTLGRAQEVVGPGIHFKWPIVQRFRVEETKDTTLDLEPQVIQLQDDLVYEVSAKLVYQIVDLRKALIEVDDLVAGLRNRLTIAVQRVVRARDRRSILELEAMVAAVEVELKPVCEQWGIRVHEFGFSDISPTPATLEVTQLRLLAEEKLRLYTAFRGEGLGEEASVALVSGAVIALRDPRGVSAPAAPPEAEPAPGPPDELALDPDAA
ncbi:MAG: SPFH domain-containing protein [Planctomycetes bacterium]|nr:SPFH domain-containing protein [Planctomycetota bacterium]